MSAELAGSLSHRRVGLVLGGGGTTGAAYHAGALLALWSDLRWDARCAEVVIGTSAGAIVGSMLRMGVAADDLAASVVGVVPGEPLPEVVDRWPTGEGLLPPWHTSLRGPVRFRSPSTVAAAVRRMWERRDPWPLMASLGSRGTFDLDEAVPVLERPWPDRALWICAVDEETLERTVFGRDVQAPWTPALRASCAVPTIMSPVEVNGRLHVDGGLHSPTNADLLVGSGVEVAVVVSPMTGTIPRMHPLGGLMRTARSHLHTEVGLLEDAGIDVVVVEPDSGMRAVMGSDPLDGSRQSEVLRAGYFATGVALAAHPRWPGMSPPGHDVSRSSVCGPVTGGRPRHDPAIGVDMADPGSGATMTEVKPPLSPVRAGETGRIP